MRLAELGAVRIAVFYVAASLLAGCSIGDGQIYYEERSPVAIEVLLSQTMVHPGDPFDIVVTVHNSGPALNLGFPNQQQFGFRILGEDGPVDGWPRIVSPALSSLFVGADESVSHSFRFQGTITAGPDDRIGNAPRRKLLPGTYWVEGGLLAHEEFEWGAAKLVVAR